MATLEFSDPVGRCTMKLEFKGDRLVISESPFSGSNGQYQSVAIRQPHHIALVRDFISAGLRENVK